MQRIDRAKQFLPFDSMKGLQEALRAEEARHERVEKRELGEEDVEHISRVLGQLSRGDVVRVVYYRSGGYLTAEGVVTSFDPVRHTFGVDGLKIPFEDIGEIERG